MMLKHKLNFIKWLMAIALIATFITIPENINAESIENVSISKTNIPNNFSNFRIDQGLPVKYIKIQVPKQNDNFLKVKTDNTLGYVNKADDATTFAMYLTKPQSSLGYEIEPSIQLQDAKNGKFLSIQSYKKNSDFFNKITNNFFRIMATANTAGYNERFYSDYNSSKNEYTVSSHLETIRDDKSFKTYYVTSSQTSGLVSTTANTEPEYYKFISAEPEGKIQIISDTVNNYANIYWKGLRSDKPANFSINKNVKINKKGNLFSAQVPLTKKVKNIAIKYHRRGKSQMSGKVKVKLMLHPGIHVNSAELTTMKKHIQKKEEPWYSDYLLLKNTVAYHQSEATFVPNACEAIGRGDQPSSNNINYFETSGNAAYFNSLEWVITGNDNYAQTAVKILNSWANKLKVLDGRDRILGAGLNCVKFATAADILSSYKGGYKGYSNTDLQQLRNMLINVIYPDLQDAGVAMIANGNWDLAAIEGLISIGVVCDNYQIYQQALQLEKDPFINGSINNYINNLGQCTEAGRDMAHAQLGIGLTAEVFQVARNQGENLFGLYDNRLAKASEWLAQYNLTFKAPSFTPLNNIFGRKDEFSYWDKLDSQSISRGELRPIYEMILSEYNSKKINLYWTKKAAKSMRPQGFVNTDNYNFDTLTFYKGPAEHDSPVFKLRQKVEPWYNRKRTNATDTILDYEPYPSYYSCDQNGKLFADKRFEQADKFKLIINPEGTVSILDLNNNKYLNVMSSLDSSATSVAVTVTASSITDESKFNLISNGLGFYSLTPKLCSSNLLESVVLKDNNVQLVVGHNSLLPSVANQNRFIFMYLTD
ncbi:alginate lyase family protein [Lactobacillus sp. ESL0791]|uniref:alginate lyase family protein n=1 Tax=Lactobacillus sp. ESL0791 TaxID=2983234 RepID=UPI0023F71D65|nr:alginate lyase family protein [Lactobacillus sp. ESL0791]MDF7637905.1 alginate lyase family protein [Lactobacillus sp. ESL0791]